MPTAPELPHWSCQIGQDASVTEENSESRLLKIEDLRRATMILLDAAVERFGAEVDLDQQPLPIGMYWALDADAAYELAPNPEQTLTIADVSADLLETADMLQREAREVVLWHDVAHLRGLLGVLEYLDLPARRDTAVPTE